MGEADWNTPDRHLVETLERLDSLACVVYEAEGLILPSLLLRNGEIVAAGIADRSPIRFNVDNQHAGAIHRHAFWADQVLFTEAPHRQIEVAWDAAHEILPPR